VCVCVRVCSNGDIVWHT